MDLVDRMTTMKILVTGFEPWGGWERNPSGDVAVSLDGERIDGAEIVTAVLPVVYGKDVEVVVPMIEVHQPQAVLSFGLSRRSCLNVERVAVNLKMDDTPIAATGPDAYLATIPTVAIYNAIKNGSVPVELSYHAGRFLCNHTMYSVLHHLRTSGSSIPSGFIHIPPTPELAVSREGSGTGLALDKTREGAVLASFLGNL